MWKKLEMHAKFRSELSREGIAWVSHDSLVIATRLWAGWSGF